MSRFSQILIVVMIIGLLATAIPFQAEATEAKLVKDGWEWYYDTTTPYELKRVVRVGGSTSVAIPDKLDGSTPLTSLGIACLSTGTDGTQITEITGMPDTVTEIKAQTCYQNSNLVSVNIGAGVKIIRSSAFALTSLVHVVIPNSVEVLGNYAFSGISTLLDVQVGTSLDNIGINQFDGCTDLSLIIFYGDPPATVGTNMFINCDSDLVGKVPIGLGWPEPGESWNGLTIGDFAPPTPTDLRAGMNGPVIHVTTDPISGDYMATAYYRSTDNITWEYRGSHLFDWNDTIGDFIYPKFYYKCRSANNWGYSDWSEIVEVNTLYTGFQLGVYDQYSKPMFDEICGEPSIWYDKTTDVLHCWYASGPSLGESTPHYLTLWYTYADNATYSNWADSVKCTGMENISRFPYVLEYQNKFYCFNSPYYNADVFLWESSDKINWTVMNGGNPVIAKSNSTISPYYNIWNVGVCIVGSTWHMWIECGANATQADTISAYTYGTLDKLDWQSHLKAYPAGILESRNVCPVYIPERNAIIIFSAKPDHVYYPGQPYPITYISVYTVSLKKDLYDPNSYVQSPYFRIGNGEDVSDPHYAIVDGEQLQGIILYYSNDAARPHIYQAGIYMDGPTFYDYLLNGNEVQTVEKEVSTTIALEDTGIIWLLIFFIVIIILGIFGGIYGVVGGFILGGLIMLLAVPSGLILFIFALISGIVLLFGREGD